MNTGIFKQTFTTTDLARQALIGNVKEFQSIVAKQCRFNRDIIQDVFIRTLENIDKYDCQRPFLQWMNGIAFNEAGMNYRKEKVRKREDVLDKVVMNARTDIEPSPAETCSNNEELAIIRASLLELDPIERKIIELFASSYSYRMIADTINREFATTCSLRKVTDTINNYLIQMRSRICVTAE